jgi:hypothetical protein
LLGRVFFGRKDVDELRAGSEHLSDPMPIDLRHDLDPLKRISVPSVVPLKTAFL